MAEHLFIIPGYSDEDLSFKPLRNLLAAQGLYEIDNILSIEYASLNDNADFRDFADRLDDIYNKLLKDGEINPRIDVLAHSTGSLVVRAWLYLRRMRQNVRGETPDIPVEHLFLFAPANFGSDLAKLGQSPLNALKVTFTKLNKKATLIGNQSAFETGRKVLQGLEPASPVQWELSNADLHHKDYAYFGPDPEYLKPDGTKGRLDPCFPFIFAAGGVQKSLASAIIQELQKDGTDSTVRIAGTSLNTRKCILRASTNRLDWQPERKFSNIAFAIFSKYDHTGIITENEKCKKPPESKNKNWNEDKWNISLPDDDWEPLVLLQEAKRVSTADKYEILAKQFQAVTESYSASHTGGIYQQFFFKVIDDTGLEVTDYFIRFLVHDLNTGQVDEKSTKALRESFGTGTEFYVHSVNPAYRVLMLNIKSTTDFIKNTLTNHQIKLEVTAKSPYFGVALPSMEFTIYDSQQRDTAKTNFFFAHTTTLVEIVLDREVDEIIMAKGDFKMGSPKKQSKGKQ
jgi:hypothetical protein